MSERSAHNFLTYVTDTQCVLLISILRGCVPHLSLSRLQWIKQDATLLK